MILVHISKSKALEWGPLDGVLLYGPPGTGKTTLVHAVARKAKVPFFTVSARDIAKAKAGKKEVEGLCAEARVYKPSIVYIKDIDAIDPNYPRPRGNGEFGVTLDEFCHEMERCMNGGNVMVIATTDRRETLDRSLMSLFFRKVHVGRPNTDNRRKFIGLQLNKFLKEEDREAICNLVASRTPGVVWGHLRKIANISLMLADIRDDDYVTMDVVLQALEKVKPLILDIKTSQLIRDDKPERVLNYQMQHMVDTMDFGYQN
uniref:probable inactive ATP-dependent zinc metalloprotease FTSHI 3, chloroplastic n=1 Tax=Erigeron canadensis TaxID=72917 RepID=UPI001CB92D81|nr:probable inactive ATP-dependent zinc metalloprotease FTSHI 3, chloroplastic [Erigeron canadensis]